MSWTTEQAGSKPAKARRVKELNERMTHCADRRTSWDHYITTHLDRTGEDTKGGSHPKPYEHVTFWWSVMTMVHYSAFLYET